MSSLVDWGLAARVAAAAAGTGPAAMAADVELERTGERAAAAVGLYTGLEPAEPLPTAEWVSRRTWAQINVASMRELIAPVEERLGKSLPLAGGGAATALRAIAGGLLAVEIGGLVGLASRRVLGQYEFSMHDPGRAPRLLFVGPNIDAAAATLPGDPATVLEWVAVHEGTHAAHFAAAPWLREHLGGLTGELLAGSTMQLSARELIARARGLLTSDPRRSLALLREGYPVTLLAPAAARETIAAVQATMASIEGYAEHVMDAAEGRIGPAVPKLREGMERRRQARSPLVRLISWLLGFEMKLRQYREGKLWADEVAGRIGIAGLNEAWRGPDALPTQAEIGDPDAWIGRVVPAGSSRVA